MRKIRIQWRVQSGIELFGRALRLGALLMEQASDRILNNGEGMVAVGPLIALIDALERKRALFWTGHVLVEFENDFIPQGPIAMVLDEDDMMMLSALKSAFDNSSKERDDEKSVDQVTMIEKLGGLTSEEAELLADRNLSEADEFRASASEDPDGPWIRFANWKQNRARLFKQMTAEESLAQDEYERQNQIRENQGRKT